MRVLVIDGQGGGLGRQLVTAITALCPEVELTAVGTNSMAASAMLKAGAARAATGENAVVVNARRADIIVGPIGIVIADARRNNVYAGFYQEDQLVAPEGHFPFEEVLERAATSEQVTFVGEITPFKEQIATSLPSATCSETLPNAVKIGCLGLKQAPASLHDFVPNYLKRVEAEENWLKDHTETTTSYIKRL